MSERNGNRKRSRKRGGRAGDGNAAAGTKGGSGKQKGSGAKRKWSKGPKIDPTVFWGDAAALPELDVTVRPSPDVTAVVASLGRPPVPGHETAAEHWFNLVYERSGVLAAALAAAGGLDRDHESNEQGAPR